MAGRVGTGMVKAIAVAVLITVETKHCMVMIYTLPPGVAVERANAYIWM